MTPCRLGTGGLHDEPVGPPRSSPAAHDGRGCDRAFLAEHTLSPSSRRIYAGALRALQDYLGGDTALAELDKTRTATRLTGWFYERYRTTAPATRVRQLAILRSACAFWRERSWLATDPTAKLERPKVPLDRTRALTREQIAWLWRRDDVALRERALWRLLCETAARANEILSLDIDDLDLPNKGTRPEQRWSHRLGALADRRGAAAAAAAGWPQYRPSVHS